jgi:hypothetical protein
MVGCTGLQVTFGDGRSQVVTHTIPRGSVKLGGCFKHHHKFVVCDITEEAILKDWLAAVNPTIDWQREQVTLTRPNGRGAPVVVHSVTSTPPTGSDAKPPTYVVSQMRAKRLLRKRGTDGYIVFLKSIEDISVLNNATVQQPAGARPPPAPDPPAAAPACDDPRVQAVLNKYASVFSTPSGLPPARGEEGHRIELEPGARPPFKPAFRMNSAELAELKRQLQELVEKGWIRPSSSMYGAPVLFVRKANGELRMCIIAP